MIYRAAARGKRRPMTYINQDYSLTASIFDRLSNFFGRVAKSLAEARAVQRTYDELDSLSQRELDDLGITKADIARIAFQSVHGK